MLETSKKYGLEAVLIVKQIQILSLNIQNSNKTLNSRFV